MKFLVLALLLLVSLDAGAQPASKCDNPGRIYALPPPPVGPNPVQVKCGPTLSFEQVDAIVHQQGPLYLYQVIDELIKLRVMVVDNAVAGFDASKGTISGFYNVPGALLTLAVDGTAVAQAPVSLNGVYRGQIPARYRDGKQHWLSVYYPGTKSYVPNASPSKPFAFTWVR